MILNEIGFSYNPKWNGRIERDKNLLSKPVEYQFWDARPSENNFSTLENMLNHGMKVTGVHLPSSYDFYDAFVYPDEIQEDIIFLQKKLSDLECVVIHPPGIYDRRTRSKHPKQKVLEQFVEDILRISTQFDVYVGIEHCRNDRAVSSHEDLALLGTMLEDYSADNVGIVLDTTHIPIIRNRRENTKTFMRYIESIDGSYVREIHISEPKMRTVHDKGVAKTRVEGHNAIDGSLLDWEKIFDVLESMQNVRPYIEVKSVRDVTRSYDYLDRTMAKRRPAGQTALETYR